jgi:outer membrane PBP1 activator LpoA protein
MSLRIYTFLLSVALLATLDACSTTSSGPAGEFSAEPGLPSETDARNRELQNHLYNMRRDPSDRSLAEVAELSNNMIGYQPDVALEVLRSLEPVPSSQLNAMIDGQLYDPEFTEWLELSLQIRVTLINGSSIAAAAQKWADYHYGHTITRANFPELVSRYRALFPVPSRVAILLPAEGGLVAAAKAIRDGILGAYLEQPGESIIRFYSSGETSESAIAAYLQAREDGAMQVIGPLRIGSTRALASLENPTVPVLLLNEPAGGMLGYPQQSAIVNSLSLSQTEEAAAIANRALAQGQKRALVLVPNNAWGTRIEAAFSTSFEQGEGQISASTRFNRITSDHSAMLTHMLKIDESKQRKADLQFLLGVPLTFEPSRRDDFDFIFMAANPEEGRELKPLLRFHDAGDIPVYAMGRIYSGQVNHTSDQDLNQIVFPTTAWQLQAARETRAIPASVRGGAFGNLYALGQDAWRLLPWLPLMQKDPDLWFPGSVGSLRLQADGRLYREPAWAQFSAGRPVPYQWPDKH